MITVVSDFWLYKFKTTNRIVSRNCWLKSKKKSTLLEKGLLKKVSGEVK